jgi:hypothetical protein
MTLASFASVLLLAGASPALAGGFQLSVETPSGSSDGRLKNAVLIARTYGCHQPTDVKLVATAEGLVNGTRKSLPLELHAIGSGVYAIKQQWPTEGNWVLAFTGAYNGMTYSVLVDLGADGKVFPGTRLDEGYVKGVHARGARRKWIAADIDAALQTPAGITSQTSEEPDTFSLSPFGPVTWLIAGMGASVLTIGFAKRQKRGHASDKIPG